MTDDFDDLEFLDEAKAFYCAEHEFVITAHPEGVVSCRGSVGKRVADCATCEQSVADAFTYAGAP